MVVWDVRLFTTPRVVYGRGVISRGGDSRVVVTNESCCRPKALYSAVRAAASGPLAGTSICG